MMRDLASNMFLTVFFGLTGMAILILAWIQPMPVSERILSTSAGAVGPLVALIRALMLKFARTGTNATPVPVEAGVQDKP